MPPSNINKTEPRTEDHVLKYTEIMSEIMKLICNYKLVNGTQSKRDREHNGNQNTTKQT